MARKKRADGRRADIAAVQNYNEKNYDRIYLTVKKGNKELLQNAAAAAGLSVNNYVCQLLAQKIPGFTVLDSENSIKTRAKK